MRSTQAIVKHDLLCLCKLHTFSSDMVLIPKIELIDEILDHKNITYQYLR